MEIYVPGIGQYDNIGDIILRRRLLRWLEPLGRLHVFVGNAPAGYAESLVGPEHVVYRSFTAWYRAALADAVRGKAAYVFKPGEIQITFAGLKEHLSTLPLLAAIKLRRKPVIRVGAGARGFERIPKLLMQPSLAMTDLIAWRDARTAAFLGRGEVMPDLAFGEGEAEPRGDEKRSLLIVSMRSDRAIPSDAWFAAVRSFADDRELDVVSVVQVERDAERSRLLADRLGGRYHEWSGDDHERHERELRELYQQTSVAVSDRLHVLITAVTEGAAPFAPLVDDSDKIDRHFAAAGIEGVSLPTSGVSEGVIRDALAKAADSWPRVQSALATARTQLESVQARVTALLRPDLAPAVSAPSAAQPTVWHVGRKGEIAGGMTQVVNAYLSWPFGTVRQRLLVSRNGTKGLSGMALFASALVRTPFLGRRDRTIVAVHLSQQGSFVREGLILRFAKRLGYSTVAHLHGSSFVDFAAGSPALVRKTLGAADVVVALSAETKAAVLGLLPDARVELVPNAVPEGRARAKEQLVVFGGGVTRRKGVDVLVEAWKRAEPDGWELHIAGPIIESDLVTDLPEGVSKPGALEHDALMTLLERSTIAVLPSRDEAMPMFVLEALARKNAVISTPVGGIPGVLGGGAGVLVTPGDADELATALRTLMDDSSELSTVSAAGFDRFSSEFSADAVYPRVERLWLSVLD
ncbi:glycosyltransferase [Microbacterium sp. SS28]|uniref:glycosyltransferase n=1 Tax=Microbacterium sp. SS28 TaxID=2919948 RepID=UPI001FA9DE84|nr:glycosyltransferase [Microbacterium sp. SS28]